MQATATVPAAPVALLSYIGLNTDGWGQSELFRLACVALFVAGGTRDGAAHGK